MVRIRDASPDELVREKRPPRAPTAKELARMKRARIFEKVLNELGAGSASLIKRVDLDEGEKLPTIRAAIARQISDTGSQVRLSVRNGAIYLSRGEIPGARAR
jgi:hypothetical protein